MRIHARPRIVLVLLLGLAMVLTWAIPTLQARSPAPAPPMGGFGREVTDRPEVGPAPRVYLNAPVSAEAAKLWIVLQKPVSMPFSQETPLEDVIKYIKSATSSPDTLPDGLPIYVDPAGLQEAERTLQSPITLSLENLPLATSLKLILDQLDLAFQVQKEGFIMISYKYKDEPEFGDSNAMILNQLAALREEVAALRAEVASLRGQPTPSSAVPGQSSRPAGVAGGGFR